MVGSSGRHAAALDELVEWWQDLSGQDINSPAGRDGAVAKVGRAVAKVSVSVPVVVIIDDAHRLEPDLAVILIENLIERINGHVLLGRFGRRPSARLCV